MTGIPNVKRIPRNFREFGRLGALRPSFVDEHNGMLLLTSVGHFYVDLDGDTQPLMNTCFIVEPKLWLMALQSNEFALNYHQNDAKPMLQLVEAGFRTEVPVLGVCGESDGTKFFFTFKRGDGLSDYGWSTQTDKEITFAEWLQQIKP